MCVCDCNEGQHWPYMVMASVSFSCWDAHVLICICCLRYPRPSPTSTLSCCHIFGQSYVVVPHVVHGTTAKFFPVKASAFSGYVCCTKYLRNTAWVLISFDSHEKKPEKGEKQKQRLCPSSFTILQTRRSFLTTSGNEACGRGTAQGRKTHRIV